MRTISEAETFLIRAAVVLLTAITLATIVCHKATDLMDAWDHLSEKFSDRPTSPQSEPTAVAQPGAPENPTQR